jgi:glutathione S-transferase
MLKLFHAWGSCSLASAIALEEAGAPHELVIMDTKAGDQRKPDYLAINPKARVPALATDRGVLTETPAILAWIAQAWPAAQLAPRPSTATSALRCMWRTPTSIAATAGRTTRRPRRR